MPPRAICRSVKVDVIERVLIAGAGICAQQKFEVHRLRELGRAAETAVRRGRSLRAMLLVSGVEQLGVQVGRQPADAERVALKRLRQVVRHLLHVVAAVAVGVDHRQQHLLERRASRRAASRGK